MHLAGPTGTVEPGPDAVDGAAGGERGPGAPVDAVAEHHHARVLPGDDGEGVGDGVAGVLGRVRVALVQRDGLPGGRYRARAWVPGLMTTGRSEVTFLPDGGKADFAFSLWGVDPAPMLEFVHGGPIYHGGTGTVAVVVTSRTVDFDGIVVTTPVPSAAVSIEVSPDVTLASSPVQFTDPQGSARFVLACPAAALSGTGSTGVLVARSGEQVETFPLPGCQPVPVEEEPEGGPETGDDGQALAPTRGAAGV